MSNYTAVNVPPQDPPREVKSHEVVLPAQAGPVIQRPTPAEAAISWLETHRKVPPQEGVL